MSDRKVSGQYRIPPRVALDGRYRCDEHGSDAKRGCLGCDLALGWRRTVETIERGGASR